MRILYLGDVVGRAGRRRVIDSMPALRSELHLDFVVVNAENATNGMGLSEAHARQFLNSGVDCLTLGDHAFDNRDMLSTIESERRIIRPLNFAKAAPGRGHGLFSDGRGRKILVLQALGQVFMSKPFSNPFSAVDSVLRSHLLGGGVNASILDIHCEATSEKMAMGHFCNGRVSIVVGSHTHVPTADVQIMSGGTAFQSDAGMCGDYNSVIGMDKSEPMRRFVTGMSRERMKPANGDATICGLFVETDDDTGRAIHAEIFKRGGPLNRGESK
ncbi:MAG: TIGR00282 family metallophosphoesterase [Roseovarius sp.]|nr:TIGR00282 family metallophosphoesterase [Roseovarius sp.]MCY4291095.1 TIGR00282 family metallophosphoesterase [Roseovarius sp.]